MNKVYRFHWDAVCKHFEDSPNIDEVSSIEKRDFMKQTVDKFARKSGVSPTNGCFFVLLFLVLFVGIMVGAYFGLPNTVGTVLVIVGPFVSFLCIVYLMSRKEPLVRVNNYVEKYKSMIEAESKAMNLTVSFQFAKSRIF